MGIRVGQGGARIRAWRRKHGYSLRACADVLKISYAQLSRIERGLCPVRYPLARAVAEQTGKPYTVYVEE